LEFLQVCEAEMVSQPPPTGSQSKPPTMRSPVLGGWRKTDSSISIYLVSRQLTWQICVKIQL